MKKFWYSVFSLMLTLGLGCHSVDSTGDKSSLESVPLLEHEEEDRVLALSPGGLFRLNSSIKDNDLSRFNYFGGFYGDQLKVYYATNVNQNINSAEVDFIALYFVDSVLAKAKYGLSENISNLLIDSLGVPKTIKHSQENIKLVNKVISAGQAVFRLNPELKSYKLEWRYGRIRILMDVNQPPDPFLGMDNHHALNYQLKGYNDRIAELYSL